MKAFQVKHQGFFHKLCAYLKEYGKLCNIHGIHYLTEKRTKIEKFFWVIILSLSFFGCIFVIIKIWKKYEESPIVVTFASKETQIYEIPFPAVTICPESKFSTTKFNYTEVYQKIMNKQTVSKKEVHAFSYLYMLCETIAEDDIILPSSKKFVDEDFFDVIDELKPDFDASCYFMGKLVNCSFVQVITDQGICYTYNMLDREELFREHVIHYKKSKISHLSNFDEDNGYTSSAGVDAYPTRALMSGADNAFEIILENTDSDYTCNMISRGFEVLIHSPLEVPRLDKSHFQVPQAKAILAAIQPYLITTADRVKKFNPDTRECYLKNEKYLKYFRVYTQSNCVLECFTNFTLEECGCIHFFMPRENGTKICSGKREDCLETAENQMKIRELERRILGLNLTHCDCKPSCNILRYNVETSQSEFYLQYYMNNLGSETTEEVSSLSHLKIYFKNDQFMTLERKELYGITDFISNFGGLLSLFTGFSLISLFEIIYFLTLRVFCNMRLHNRSGGSLD